MAGNLRPIAKCSPHELRGKCEREASNVLRSLRRSVGLSQAAFAERIACDKASVENWERRRRRVPAFALLAAEELALDEETGT
jgi:DNA-binding transcriptional regulator YiaG